MKRIIFGELKANFHAVLKQVKYGISIAITYGRKRNFGYFLPKSAKDQNKCKLGLMAGKATVVFTPDFKITEDDFIG